MAIKFEKSRFYPAHICEDGTWFLDETDKQALKAWMLKHKNTNVLLQVMEEKNDFNWPWLKFIHGYVVESLRNSEYWRGQCYSHDEAYLKCFKEIWFAMRDGDGEPVLDLNKNIITFSLAKSGEIGEFALKALWPFIQKDAAETYGVVLLNKGEYVDWPGGGITEYDLDAPPYSKERLNL